MNRNTNSRSSTINRKRTFLLGKGIGYSISPQIQNAAFKKLRIQAEYNLLDIDEKKFESTIQKISESDDIIGFNVTVPYKEWIIEHLSSIDQRSKDIGAVNAVTIQRKGILRGFNTDCDGIRATLENLGIKPDSGQRGIVLGAGGAARACVYTLGKIGFDSVCILNRTASRARALANHFRMQFPKMKIDIGDLTEENLHIGLGDCDLLINSTSSSTGKGFPIRLDLTLAQKRLKAFDLGYRSQGPFLKTVLQRGFKATDGLLMLVEQAASSFEIWTGKTAPRKEMMAAAKLALNRK